MTAGTPRTILCLASYFKGEEFLRECKRRGWFVLLLTSEKHAGKPWPRESVDELRVMPDLTREADVLKGVSWLARSRRIERVVPLDEFDLEVAAAIREHLRIPGMGSTTARYFRDKLAMRMRAEEHGIRIPRFTPLFNDGAVREYVSRVPAPWLVKPRSSAAAIGIRRVDDAAALWTLIERLGDERPLRLLEELLPGDVYHVDGIVEGRRVLFAAAHRYGRPPMHVAHQGGVATTCTVDRSTSEHAELLEANRRVVEALGLVRGVVHVEFLRERSSGELHFIEAAARVGGAYIADVVEAAAGVQLWREWARLETSTRQHPYRLPEVRGGHAGLVLSLARQESPDTSAYDAPEVVRRLSKRHHAGLIVASDDAARVQSLVEDYGRRFEHDFLASLPPPEKPED
ncbi:MAG: acetyl-CoA carboxylase biotin carboxylase subunit family protein [Gemmatimonadota bacterium]